jgi:signal transduction histidine kinase
LNDLLAPDQVFKRIKFTVDSALLRELGERLVGKPFIALAELVKNSYDADATKVIIRFGPDIIEIIDNGQGMDFSEFKAFWMRVGSQHKQAQKFSRRFARPITGSKGVGRLAVQFLARTITMRTVSDKDLDSELEVFVDWKEAVETGELTEATAQYRGMPRTSSFPEGKNHGTAIILSGLNQSWSNKEIVDLAKEIWPLRPPFQTRPELIGDVAQGFDVDLQSPDEETVELFKRQMEAILDIWTARIFGKLVSPANDGKCDVQLFLEFDDGKKFLQKYSISDCKLHMVQFEIRVFTLEKRQPFGIKVDLARDYFRQFGGIHVYDAGFHLPYYGYVESDWLRIQYDHASRRHRSQLLPEELQVFRGLQFLPTIPRLFGVVHVDTALEQRETLSSSSEKSEDFLKIQVTRDRLVDNNAYRKLVEIVRWALDFYAMQEARRNLIEDESKRFIEPVEKKFERVDELLSEYEKDIPAPVFDRLKTVVTGAIASNKARDELVARQTALLGALATAGMSALAYEHEAKKQHTVLLDIAGRLHEMQVADAAIRKQIDEIVQRLNDWLDRSRALRALFIGLLDEGNRATESRFNARNLIKDVAFQLSILLRGVRVDTLRVDESLRLPLATYAEWSAIFQNIFINAINAMLDSPFRKIDVSSRIEGKTRCLLVQDTGIGVDLEMSEELFRPFVRKLEISQDRRALGLGGTGLGLTIVRMIADSRECSVGFIEPEKGFDTAFRILWKET